MRLERRIEWVIRLKGLNPDLAAVTQHGVAPGASCSLHQQGKQALGGTEVAGEQGAVRVDGRHQGDAAKVMALGDHLRAHQHIHLARMHGRQLGFQRTLQPGAVGVDAGYAQRLAVRLRIADSAGSAHIGQQLAQLFFQLLGAATHGFNVDVAAGGAGAWHALGKAAMVAAQGAVYLVKHAEGRAMRALTFPAAVGAMQHGGIAAPVQKHHALFAVCDALADGVQQRQRENGMAWLVVHVHPPHQGQTLGRTRLQAHGLAGSLVCMRRRCGQLRARGRWRLVCSANPAGHV